jgi:hypothetical protein
MKAISYYRYLFEASHTGNPFAPTEDQLKDHAEKHGLDLNDPKVRSKVRKAVLYANEQQYLNSRAKPKETGPTGRMKFTNLGRKTAAEAAYDTGILDSGSSDQLNRTQADRVRREGKI